MTGGTLKTAGRSIREAVGWKMTENDKLLKEIEKAADGKCSRERITQRLDEFYTTPEEKTEKLRQIAAFVRQADRKTAELYLAMLRWIPSTKEEFEIFTNDAHFKFINGLGPDLANQYINRIGTAESMRFVTPQLFENLPFLKALDTETAHSYIDNLKWGDKQLVDPRVTNNAAFINSLKPDVRSAWFSALATTQTGQEFTTKTFTQWLQSANTEVVLAYFKALETCVYQAKVHASSDTNSPNAGAAAAFTDAKLFGFIGEIGATAAVAYFTKIEKKKDFEWFMDQRVLDMAGFLKEIGGEAAAGYFDSVGGWMSDVKDKFAALTDPKILTTADFVKHLSRDNAQKYFSHIYSDSINELTDPRFFAAWDTIATLENLDYYLGLVSNSKMAGIPVLTDASFLDWYKTTSKLIEGYGTRDLVWDICRLAIFSETRGLCKGEYSFKNDPIIRLLRPERLETEQTLVAYELSLWEHIINDRLKGAEKEGLGAVDNAAFERLFALVSRTGGSPVYLDLALNFIRTGRVKFTGDQKEFFERIAKEKKENFSIILSGEKGRIDKLILEGVNYTFNNIQGLPTSIEGYGGADNLRLIWESRNHFEANPELLTQRNFKDYITKKNAEKFAQIESKLPNFHSPLSLSYNLVSKGKGTRKLSKEELQIIINDCNEMVKLVFTPPKTEISVEEQFEALKKSVGKGLKGKLDYLWKKHKPSEKQNLVDLLDFAKALRELEKDLKSMARSDPARYTQAIHAHGQILNAIEVEFAGRYYSEKLQGKVATDILSAQEILSLVFQYVQDPDFHGTTSPGRALLFSDCAKVIAYDSRILGEAIPNVGIMTVKSWNRSLEDIFGGRNCGDCTAPPNTGEYSGINFHANFQWINDAGTSILNFYWQKDPKVKPEPVGRVYLFASELDGKPAVFIDSIEFLASFPPGPEVKKAVVQMMKDMAMHFGVPVAIEAGGARGISNRPWVCETIENSGLRKTGVTAVKLGDKVYAEHIRVEAKTMKVFIAGP